jgi:hypothetical protein
MTLRPVGLLVVLIFVAGVRTAEAQCTVSVSPTAVSVPSTGSTSALSVVTGSSCSWTATSSVSWITVTSATGLGLGQVNYVVAANSSGTTRTGALLVAGQSVPFTQPGATATAPAAPTNLRIIR